MSSTPVPDVTLNNGVTIPQLGFGVFQVGDDEATAAVTNAIEVGYRSIDTAAIYGNEAGVGRALAASSVPREELFVTTKLWNTEQGYDSTLAAFEESARLLGLDYVDMYLIHWPAASRDRYLDTWRAFEKLLADGRVRTIGVSNFQPEHLTRLLEHTAVMPSVNQVELHPYLQQGRVRAYDRAHAIATEAWSPLGKGGALLADPVITEAARAHGKSPAQVVLRWHLHLGNIVIPKSVTPARIRENFEVFDFDLDAAELDAIGRLDRGERLGPDPDEVD
ncbi:aldo/keto reductase [Embleya sp. NPDC055664]|uniref:aldo/keto reductase n=1 Tax=unclassified Embleya TaxID=2699296 RepID=UPI00367FAE85